MISNNRSQQHNSSAGKARKLSRTDEQDPQDPIQQALPEFAQRHNAPPTFLTPTRDLYVDMARVGTKITTIHGFDEDGDRLRYSLAPAQYHDASPYFSIHPTSGELKLISKPPKSIGVCFLNVVTSDGEYDAIVELRIHAGRDANAQTGANELMEAKTQEFLEGLNAGNFTQRPIIITTNSSRILNPPLGKQQSNKNIASTQLEDQQQDEQDASEEYVSLEKQDPTDQHEQRLQPKQQQQQSPKPQPPLLVQPQASIVTQPSRELAPMMQPATIVDEFRLSQQPTMVPVMMFSIFMIVFACVTIAFVLRLKRRLKTVERQHEQLSRKTSYGDSSLGTNSQFSFPSSVSCPNQAISTALMNSIYLDQISNSIGCNQHLNRDHNGRHADDTMTTGNIYCHMDDDDENNNIDNNNDHQTGDEFYSTINTDSTLVDEHIIATHNYNLYTLHRNRLALERQQTDRLSTGGNHICPKNERDLPGHVQTADPTVGCIKEQLQQHSMHSQQSSMEAVHQSAQPASPCSSTKSLAKFLSLSSQHWSHHQQDAAVVPMSKTSKQDLISTMDDLRMSLNAATLKASATTTTTTISNPIEEQLAKTIARADRIGREQQALHRRQVINHHKSQQNINISDTLANNSATATCKQDLWEIERHKLRFINILDEGQFGLVWRCKLKLDSDDGNNNTWPSREVTVAVKTLKSFAAKDAEEREELLFEIEIMKLVCNHPNVVRILHCCTRDISPSRPILLVMEYVELGKLQSFLERSRESHQYATTSATFYSHACPPSWRLTSGTMDTGIGQDYRQMAGSIASSCSIIDGDYDRNIANVGTDNLGGEPIQQQQRHTRCNGNADSNKLLTSRDLIKFIYHVAKGMEHISSNCIVHRDLASRNILISSQRVCKIGDFGMARHVANMSDVYERRSRNTKVPVRWMAPEVLVENSFTTKSDVFSFGILMWEIVTLGSTPYRHLSTEQIVQAVARDGQRPEKPEHCHEILYDIMSRCWAEDPSKRPTFKELVAELDRLVMGTEEYIQLDQFPDNNYYNLSQLAAPFELL